MERLVTRIKRRKTNEKHFLFCYTATSSNKKKRIAKNLLQLKKERVVPGKYSLVQ